MSQENVELVKSFTSRFEAGNRNVWRDYFDPDVVWDTSASTMPSAGIYHGHDGVERFFREWLGAWTDYKMEAREYIDAGSSVVIVFRQGGIGRGSGVRSERDFFGVYDLNDSKVIRYRQYESRKEALEAAGLSEDNPLRSALGENATIIKRGYEAWNRRDVDAVLALLHPEIRWEGYAHIPESGTLAGHDEVRVWFERFWEAWEMLDIDVIEMIESGDRVLALVRFRGVGKGSGVKVESGIDAHAWTMQDGKAVAVRLYQGTPEALEALGL